MDLRRIASAAIVLAATALLGACAVYPDDPAYGAYPYGAYPAAPMVHGGGAPVVVVPAPVYAAPPPVWYGPSISIGISGRSGHRERRDHDHDHRRHRRHDHRR